MKKWGLILLFALCVLGVQAQESGGGYIAFVTKREINDDIYLTNLSGTQVFNLTQSRSRNWHPTWSPDGTQIAYNSDQNGNAEIYVMNNNGTGKTNVSKHPANDTSPDWSPVADDITFVSDRDGGIDLYILSLSSGAVRRLTTDGITKSEPDWSPDGRQIAYWQQIDQATVILNRVDVASGEITTVIDNGQALWPAWSPDGRHIAYFSAPKGSADILTVELSSGTVTDLSNSQSNDARPDWSPDGAQIVFMSDRDGNFNLYTMKGDGSHQQRLTDAPEDDHSAVWQPVPAPIDYDPTALGQNVNVVQGDISPEAQGELGAGKRRLFAPETVFAEDIIRVRFEIDVDSLDIEATPAPTPDIPLRDDQALTVYRFMGAELTGLDLGRFDVFPDPSGYVLQIREDGENYWEWMLRPKIPDALGRNFLAVRLYLPESHSDGVIVRTELDTVGFDVEVVGKEPEVQSEYALHSMEPVERQGINMFYSDQNVLSITFANETDVSDMTIATDYTEFPILGDFPIFGQTGNRVPANTCIYYERQGEEPVLPRLCRSGTAYDYPLVPGEIFWYNPNARQLRDVVIRHGGRAFICSARSEHCEF